MAVQDDLAAALASIAAATNALNTVGAQATGAINAVTATYNNRLATMQMTLVINQITGSDSNPGTAAAPLRSLQAAVDKAPLGSYLLVQTQTDYTIDKPTIIRNKFVVVASDSGVRRRINFGVGVDTNFTPNSRVCYGFNLSGNASVTLFLVRLVFPAMDAYGNYQDRNSATMFKPATQVEQGAQSINIQSCDVDIPVTSFGAMVLDNWPIMLTMGDIALVGSTTSINGRIMRGVTAVGGTAATTLPQLLTNLTML